MVGLKYYAGVGSRDTQEPWLTFFSTQAEFFACNGWTLRSGGAIGADKAFESGVDKVLRTTVRADGKRRNPAEYKEIFLKNYEALPEAYEMARALLSPEHWANLERKKATGYMARNVHQVLGKNLDEPVEFVMCWTPDGKPVGGTKIAIEVAQDFGIPVINMGSPDGMKDYEKHFKLIAPGWVWGSSDARLFTHFDEHCEDIKKWLLTPETT